MLSNASWHCLHMDKLRKQCTRTVALAFGALGTSVQSPGGSSRCFCKQKTHAGMKCFLVVFALFERIFDPAVTKGAVVKGTGVIVVVVLEASTGVVVLVVLTAMSLPCAGSGEDGISSCSSFWECGGLVVKLLSDCSRCCDIPICAATFPVGNPFMPLLKSPARSKSCTQGGPPRYSSTGTGLMVFVVLKAMPLPCAGPGEGAICSCSSFCECGCLVLKSLSACSSGCDVPVCATPFPVGNPFMPRLKSSTRSKSFDVL